MKKPRQPVKKAAAEVAPIALAPPAGVRWTGWIAAAGVTAVALCLHWVFKDHAGGLWRDEVNSVNVASMPTLGEVWTNTEFDSFPMFWILILRGWCAMGLDSDAALRVLGLLTGLLTLGMLWLACRRMGSKVPLLCLAIFAMNPEAIRRGDSVRGYGLGAILIVLAMVLLWEMMESPSRRRIAAATIASVLSIQTLYFNTVLLAAIGAGAVVVALRRRLWKRAVLPVAIGLVSGLTLLPNLSILSRMNRWNIIVRHDLTLEEFRKAAQETLGSAGSFMMWVWLALVVGGLVAAGVAQSRWLRPGLSDKERDRALYVGTALLVGSVLYFAFIKLLRWDPNPWHFYAWMAFAALCGDVLIAGLRLGGAWGVSRAVCAAVLAAATFVPALRAVQVRMTNMDQLASALNGVTREGDLILIKQWMFGIPLRRYYHGPAPWMTMPSIDDHRSHRFDLVAEKRRTPDAIADVRSAMIRTLKSGHRVWFLDDLPLPPRGGYVIFDPARGLLVADAGRLPPGELPNPIPPANEDPNSLNWPFQSAWSLQLGYIAENHATAITVFSDRGVESTGARLPEALRAAFPPSFFQGVSRFECTPVTMIEGWRE